ncbi:MAG: helix-turn-helix domain-containing protein, partial [Jiangellaceae bacterium]
SDEHVRLGCTVLAAYYERGDLVRAQALATTLMSLADAEGAPHTRGAAYWNASIVAESRGETAQALVLVERALAMFGESDDTRNLARLRVAYAWLLMQEPEPRAMEAMQLLNGVEAQITAHGSAVEISSFNTERARAFLALGRVDEARESVEESLTGLGDKPRIETARARLLRARILRQQGATNDAVLECAGAAQTLESMGAGRQAAAAWRELADLYRELGRADDAMNSYDRALRSVRVAPAAATGIVNLADSDVGGMLGLESV